MKLWGYDTNDIYTVQKYVESIRDAYQKSSTPTIKHLIEITHDTFKKTPRPGTHTPVGNPLASEGLDIRAPEGEGARGSRYWPRAPELGWEARIRSRSSADSRRQCPARASCRAQPESPVRGTGCFEG